ncbi:hypothetical protein CFC21_050030 [Triticum aestivum]|uniref:Ubiquitin-like protease family profile domain-containing protein n=2 Tax=Triticum aestivum TaxID=4565 RepID=A0A3B6H2E2_WHEAT|nr:hypothetical protein CFC21_050030 [Triticum aestivum]
MGSYSILRPPGLNFPSPVCRAMRQPKSKVLATAAPPGFSSAGPPGFSTAPLHGSRGQDLVGGLGGDKDNVDQVSHGDVAIGPDLASVDLSAGDLPTPSDQLLLPAQPSCNINNAVAVVSKVATSTSHNSQASEQTASKGKGQSDAAVVTSKATQEVITVEDAEERVQMHIDPPGLRRNPVEMDTYHEMVPKFPEIQSDASVQAPTDIVQPSPSALAVTAPRPAKPPTVPYVVYPLASTREDEVSASKEAMISAELVSSKQKDATNSSEVLKAHNPKSCELESKHLALQAEVKSLRAKLEKEKRKNEKLEKEKAIMGGKLAIPGSTMPCHNNQGECTIFSSRWLDQLLSNGQAFKIPPQSAKTNTPRRAKADKQIPPFKITSLPPKKSNHSTYNLRDKTSKGMLDDEIFELYMEDLWTGLDPEKKSDYAYLDSLWGHWSLLVLCNFGDTNYLGTPKGPRMLLLDSLRTTQPKRLPSVINSFITDILKTEEREDIGQFTNQVHLEFPEVPRQSGSDCGIYVLYFIYCFLKIKKLGEDLSQLGALFDPEVLQNLEDIRKAILLYQEKQHGTITE